MFCQCFLGHPNQTGCRRIHFKATLSAASALRTIYRNYSVTDFSTAEVRAAVNLAVNDDTATNTSAQCNADCILCTLCSTCNIFAVSSCICIVFNECLLAEGIFHILYHRSVDKAQIVGIFDDTSFAVCNTRCTNADPFNLIHSQTGFFGCFLCNLCHICCNFLFRTWQVGLYACLCKNFICFVYHACYDIRTA